MKVSHHYNLYELQIQLISFLSKGLWRILVHYKKYSVFTSMYQKNYFILHHEKCD